MEDSSLYEDIRVEELEVAKKYVHLCLPYIHIKNTKDIARRYSHLVLKPKVFLPSTSAFWIPRIGIAIACFTIALQLLRTHILPSSWVSILIVFFLFAPFVSFSLLSPRYKHPSMSISLCVSETGIYWGDTLYTWLDIESIVIVTVTQGPRYRHYALHIISKTQGRIRLSLDSIIGIRTQPSDIASAIEHFRQRYQSVAQR